MDKKKRKVFSFVALLMLASQIRAQDKQVELPKPVRVEPVAMPKLPPAVIDDALAIEGQDIEARKVRSRMTVNVQVNGTGPYRFVVDSGADSSVIGTRIARTLQLPAGLPVTLNGMTGSSIVPRVIVDDLQLGSTDIHDLELPVLREADLGGDGMLGIDALAGQRLMLDFEKRTITVQDASHPAPRMDGEIVVTARRKRGQLILTQVKANGRQVDAVIDTGSEITVGNRALRDYLVRRKTKMETIGISGVTGETIDLEIARVAEIRLGSVILRDVPIAFADLPPFDVFGLSREPSMLLGTDLMEAFRRVSLDFKHRKVRFQLRRCETVGFFVNASTLSSSASRIGVERGTTEACRR